ncbi:MULTISPECIES: hypothetical protein [unclassified Amycolatopsis]|uniref:hypothetical protein n=1 Tax=unclassified Amycolatopsis TaxID=2618356 RepID=UPI002874F6DA|nr:MULTISPECIES: hypothetical protein [unclassified Amycolatopsis]MDS0137554.1 hypothetical protein [Amycolatopsis sp. 505]MDS0141749.1 hypothetical protein [Amycolatopsis sp. CM201R]
MPDGDYLAWRVGGKWRKVANLLKAHASSIKVEDALAAAVANSIRASGGIPEFADVVDRVRHAASGGGEITATRPGTPGSVLGRLLDEVAPTLVEAMQRDLKLVSPVAATELAAERFLTRIAEAGLDQMLPTLVANGYTMAQLRNLFTILPSSPPMAALRGRFIKHPSGEGLVAPRRRMTAKPLGELIVTGLDDL